MLKHEIIIAILTAICLIGIIILLILDRGVGVLIPIFTVLSGYLLGRKEDNIVGYLRKRF